MMTIKLSDKNCLICGSKEHTLVARDKKHDFQGVVCSTHLFALLKKWEQAGSDGAATDTAAASAQPTKEGARGSS